MNLSFLTNISYVGVGSFPIFLTKEQPSPHGSRQWLKCPQYMGINQTSMFEGTNQVYAVTAWSTVPAAFAGVHRNHHFDTIQRLHPLLHPLHPGNGLGYSSIYRKLQGGLFFHEKRDINAPGSISLSSYYNSLVKHQSDKLKFDLPIFLKSHVELLFHLPRYALLILTSISIFY